MSLRRRQPTYITRGYRADYSEEPDYNDAKFWSGVERVQKDIDVSIDEYHAVLKAMWEATRDLEAKAKSAARTKIARQSPAMSDITNKLLRKAGEAKSLCNDMQNLWIGAEVADIQDFLDGR